jgi:hypothetical protein
MPLQPLEENKPMDQTLLCGNMLALGHNSAKKWQGAEVHYHLTLQEGRKIVLKYQSIVSVFFIEASQTLGKE